MIRSTIATICALALSMTLSACYADVQQSDTPDVGAESTPPIGDPPRIILSPDARLCPDETADIESDTNINAACVSLVTMNVSRTFIAWKYAPTLTHTMGKVCIAAQAAAAPTRVYLLDDASGAPGGVLKSGDLYNTAPGFLCTLDAPFDFSAGVTSGHTYWIATNADLPTVANDGARIPYWVGGSDPGVGVAKWALGCSAGFVATLGVKR